MKRKIFSLTLLIFIGLFTFLVWNRSGVISESDQKEQQAIQQAINYQPDGVCTQALVPAVHTETGAHYTFPSGCLAPGWEPVIDVR